MKISSSGVIFLLDLFHLLHLNNNLHGSFGIFRLTFGLRFHELFLEIFFVSGTFVVHGLRNNNKNVSQKAGFLGFPGQMNGHTNKQLIFAIF